MLKSICCFQPPHSKAHSYLHIRTLDWEKIQLINISEHQQQGPEWEKWFWNQFKPLNPSSPLAISVKLVCLSAGYLWFSRGESLIKLVCSGVHFSGPRGPDMGRDRGRNQKGMADSRVMTPAMRYPNHQAPTQRASAGVMVMVSRRKQEHKR